MIGTIIASCTIITAQKPTGIERPVGKHGGKGAAGIKDRPPFEGAR